MYSYASTKVEVSIYTEGESLNIIYTCIHIYIYIVCVSRGLPSCRVYMQPQCIFMTIYMLLNEGIDIFYNSVSHQASV
jgi:hypothetical protein